MEFVEARAFTAHLPRYLDDEGYRRLQLFLLTNPDAGDVIPDAGGLQKLRWADARRGKGRRGGLRVIYLWIAWDQTVWLLSIYDKDEMADLTAKERRSLRQLVEAELAARRRQRRKP
jgi:mRNA-degrading endonuclease RelE of RelBE toxin-antitoxin system